MSAIISSLRAVVSTSTVVTGLVVWIHPWDHVELLPLQLTGHNVD
jgi:hypothetical protein